MFIYNLEDIAKKLKIDFDGITKQIVHNGVKGSAREDLLKDYLKVNRNLMLRLVKLLK